MALLHAATITPTKAELVGRLVARSTWAPPGAAADAVELVGAYRFDDPEGSVGLETHLARCGDVVVQVPLTYRDAPSEAAAAGFVATMEHSVLGTRWVYDGMHDPAFTAMLAAATLTGVGQAVEVLTRDGRRVTRVPSVRLGGVGWDAAPGTVVAVDALGPPADEDGWTVVRSPELELRVARRPRPGSDPVGLTGTWPGRTEPALLAAVRFSTTGSTNAP